MDILWENASPTSDFAKQTLSIDLSEYNYVCITFNIAPDMGGFAESQFAKVNGEGFFVNFVCQSILCRQGRASNSGVWFDNGGYVTLTTGAYTNKNTSMVPLRIIGIKVIS